jgi:non-specific protein-tyrosine kinase
MATVADGAILVARSGSTTREQVRQAADALQQVNARLLGTVLNFAPQRKRRGYGSKYDYGYGYGYGYGHGKGKDAAAPEATKPNAALPVANRQD